MWKEKGQGSRRASHVYIVVVLTLAGQTALGQLSLTEVNKFPFTVTAEAVADHPTRVTAEFGLFFPVDETQYVPVNQQLADLLSSNPLVSSDPEISVRPVSTQCLPKQLDIVMGTDLTRVDGAWVTSILELTGEKGAMEGLHEITLSVSVRPTAPLIRAEVRP